ncbi:MAG: HAD-IA family hydrolase [Thiotrichales bacterium]|jgi:phosphoglycolate phosphatase|nr:HAD-IA family hydrolase [Thiotrichales bacterium]MBT3613988.1 HAD-IA family hydrolase [Thiotrichales bacterium]MBT3752091.1 HAD-IA family hydrolase [Thiotrichales bacterium]MBT3836805.1 HAD-IA family hydrolase [Thiotrichales bacterium]MBT4151579.1 HAD-IA family hydrolase [Thiotrichales bacterium]
MKTNAILFDLDGTLIDTAPDLAYALNEVLNSYSLPLQSIEKVREVASFGSTVLLKLGLGESLNEVQFEEARQRLFDIYSANIANQSCLMSGMETLLEDLERQHILWGVVTNKPKRFTDPLMVELGLADRSATTVSGDTTDQAKPHPKPMLYACREMSVTPQTCIYIGDAERDIVAGRAAEMTTLAARFGYLAPDDKIDEWGAEGVIDHPIEIMEWINSD